MEFLLADVIGKPLWMWVAFLTVVAALLAFDLGILHRTHREIGVGESLKLSVLYIAVAVLFGGWVWWSIGPTAGMWYFTGYTLEKALAMDNVFVISLIFQYFAIPRQYQHRVLFWGILAVIVLRGIMIAGGAALVENYGWVLYIFAAFLILTGVKMLIMKEFEPDPSKNPVLRFLARRMRVTDEIHGQRFWVRKPDPKTGRLVLHATPLFLALIMIELADVAFAIDSVPAIFAITTDTFIVFTANIMAILGLRALYFALAAVVHRFAYLRYGLAIILVFVGAKIFWNDLFGKVPAAVSLGVVLALIAGGILYSLWKTRAEPPVPAVEVVSTAAVDRIQRSE